MYDDFLSLHFERLEFTPPPLENFWEVLEELDWPTGGQEAFAQRAHERLSFSEALCFEHQLNELADVLQAAAVEAIKASGNAPATPYWDEDLWDASRHVVGLGKEAYEAMLADPASLLEVEAEWGLGFIINAAAKAPEVAQDELEKALRLGSRIKALDDPEGIATSDVVEHPQHGLGFLTFDVGTPWMWLVFRNETMSTQRHAVVSESTTLYRADEDGRLEYWYGGLGRGSTNDIFMRSGPVGFHRGGTIVPPSDDGPERFQALVEEARHQGFGTVEPPTTPFAIRLQGFGLEQDPEQARGNLHRMQRETGLGSVTHLRAGRDESMYFGQSVDLAKTAMVVGDCWDDIPEFSVFDLSGDDAVRVAGEVLDLELPTPPCEVHEDLAYFSRLSITPHPETAQWAAESAARANLDSLDQLDERIAEARAQHGRGELDAVQLSALAEQLGAFAGEALRADVGGEWGVGTLFTERLWYGFLVGDAKIRWWPVREVQTRIDGSADGSFAERCHKLAERSRQAPFEPAERVFTLAGGEGYFDAGTTSDGRQALMGAFWEQTFALFFDTDGRLLEYATRPLLPGRPSGQPDHGPSRSAIEAWQAELGFEPADIRVKRFSCRAAGVGIEDLPSHLEEFLEDPDGFNDEDRVNYPIEIQKWIENGDFVLYWGNDLWLDGNGHVTST